VDKILKAARSRTQTILTSATLNDDVESLIKKHIGEHVRVEIESRSLTVDEVDQTFYVVEPERKYELLAAVLDQLKPERCLVFVRTRFSVDRITWRLQEKGYAAELLHSGIPQRNRERILESFRQGNFPVLIATDVAARGLHIEDVSHVVNYDLPQNPEDYVHRVGRTARMGKRGTAVSFVTRDDGPYLTAIEKLINKEIRQVVFPGFEPRPVQAPTPEAAPEPAAPIPGIPPWARPARRRR
jgi:ATP-dependent RNA helicase DeaD